MLSALQRGSECVLIHVHLLWLRRQPSVVTLRQEPVQELMLLGDVRAEQRQPGQQRATHGRLHDAGAAAAV